MPCDVVLSRACRNAIAGSDGILAEEIEGQPGAGVSLGNTPAPGGCGEIGGSESEARSFFPFFPSFLLSFSPSSQKGNYY